MKTKVVATLKKHGVYYFFPLTYGMGRSGVPDIVCCLNGKFLGIECKAGENTLTPLQEAEHSKIMKAGGAVITVRETNIDAVSKWLEYIKKLS